MKQKNLLLGEISQCAFTAGAGKPCGLLTRTFPNLHSGQAFYDELATRYFPDLADARSSLQYLTLVLKSVCDTSDREPIS